MKHRLLSAVLAAALCTAGMSVLSGEVSAAETGTSLSAAYRKKYKEILDSTEYFQGVYIGDLVGDSREEMVVATNSFGMYTLYTPVGKKIMKYDFDVMSVWGFTKYIKADRKFICMNYYGHTTGAPYAISMETISVKDDKFDRYWIECGYNDKGDGLLFTERGKEITSEEFSLDLNYMIAETARSEYIPFVRHKTDDEDLEGMDYYEGGIDDISYEDYIKKMLG